MFHLHPMERRFSHCFPIFCFYPGVYSAPKICKKKKLPQGVITTHFFKQFYSVILSFLRRGTRYIFSMSFTFQNLSELNILLSTSSFCIKSCPFFCKVITQKKARAARNMFQNIINLSSWKSNQIQYPILNVPIFYKSSTPCFYHTIT